MSASALLVSACAAGAVMALVPVRHRRPERIELMVRPVATTQREGVVERLMWVPEGLGRLIRLRLGRRADAVSDRRVGLAVAGGLCGLLIHPVVTLLVVVSVFAVPVMRKRRESRIRREQVREQLPDVVDMVRIAVGAGMTARLAIDAIATRCDGVIGDRLREVSRRVSLGQRLHEALDAFGELGEPVMPLTRALIAAESDGSPLAPSLEQVAAETRMLRRHAAEESARRLPVKLLFPLVACILPAFILLTVVPLLGGAIASLDL